LVHDLFNRGICKPPMSKYMKFPCPYFLIIVDKGMLHAVTYAGMIISAVPWGFIADTIGRRPVLISGGWLDGFFVLCASFSQDTAQLMAFKFFDGFM